MEIFHISGYVIDQKTHQGIAALRVEVWDKDLIFNDLVGSSVTDEQGAFQITFNESYFREMFLDRRPDLFFKVFYQGQLIKSTEDSVLWNVATENTQITVEIEDTTMVDQQTIVLSQNLIDIATLNPGIAVSNDQFNDIILPQPRTISIKGGCIITLRYGLPSGGTDLTWVQFKSGESWAAPPNVGTFIIENLNDFRDLLLEAANFGHGVDACYNTGTRRMFMLNLRPCKCLCEKDNQPQPPTIPPVFVPPVVTNPVP